jgi:NAD(P)-dependent dehydrogenase (short-subunit alcohol dehydrogenase family)
MYAPGIEQVFGESPAARYRSIKTEGGNSMRLAGKVAVVTGAGTGIGQAIAIAFAEAGAAVVVDYVGKASVSEDTISKIKALGGKSLGVDADISIENDVNGLIQKTVAAFGKLDIFVNNAGIEKKIPFVDYPLEEWQKIFAVNLTGPFLCSQSAAKQMIQLQLRQTFNDLQQGAHPAALLVEGIGGNS